MTINQEDAAQILDEGVRIPAWTRGDRLRKARQLTGMTSREFAVEIGVSQATVTNAENDHNNMRNITLNAWALATGVPRQWLETGTAPEISPGGGSGADDGTRTRNILLGRQGL